MHARENVLQRKSKMTNPNSPMVDGSSPAALKSVALGGLCSN
jgi:hypothetical protein